MADDLGGQIDWQSPEQGLLLFVGDVKKEIRGVSRIERLQRLYCALPMPLRKKLEELV